MIVSMGLGVLNIIFGINKDGGFLVRVIEVVVILFIICFLLFYLIC